MQRFVNIFMILIIVSCPFRCMTQGCGCFKPVNSQAATAQDGFVVGESCCCKCSQDKADHSAPTAPPKCDCKCFCSGVIVASHYEVPSDLMVCAKVDWSSFEPTISCNRGLSIGTNYPPDHPPGVASNRGRQIRCLIHSYLI